MFHAQHAVAIGAMIALVGCGTSPAANVQSQKTPKIPTPAELVRILPATLTGAQAERMLVKFPASKILLPADNSKLHTSWLGRFGRFGSFGLGRGWGLGWGGAPWGAMGWRGYGGFYPFSYYGANYYAPYYLGGAGLWSPLASSPFLGSYGYLGYPFAAAGCGSLAPYGMGSYGLGAYGRGSYGMGAYGMGAYGLGLRYGALGCGAGLW